MKTAKPFLKWTGGKQRWMGKIKEYFPEHSFRKYVEPFLGGGSVFLWMCKNNRAEEAVISDLNKDLITVYETIRLYPEELIRSISELKDRYMSLRSEQKAEMYYSMRIIFNGTANQYNQIERAALFIFLNKTCFNGLYRVNSKGENNSPFGKYENPEVFIPENIGLWSMFLKKTEIIQGDFTVTERFIDENSFVYLDPPYKPLRKTSSFTQYTNSPFNDNEQIRLCEYFKHLDKKGAKILLSNSCTDDGFFEKYYSDYKIEKIQVSRTNGGRKKSGTPVTELLIMNY